MPVLKSIILTDVASGFSHHSPVITITDKKLSDCSNNEIYDISCNIFQIQIRNVQGESLSNNFPTNIAIIENDLFQNPYQQKKYINESGKYQWFDISFVPLNYQPYRYLNKKITSFFGQVIMMNRLRKIFQLQNYKSDGNGAASATIIETNSFTIKPGDIVLILGMSDSRYNKSHTIIG